MNNSNNMLTQLCGNYHPTIIEESLIRDYALRMAKSYNVFFKDAIAITGGTVSEKVPDAYRDKAITPIDSCAVEGRCNTNRNPELDSVSIPNYKIVYGTWGKELEEMIKGNNIYASGGTIANPFVRYLNTQMEFDEINTVTIGDLIERRRFPATFALEPQKERDLLKMSVLDLLTTQEIYKMPAEAYRMVPKRPNWIVDLELNKDKVSIPYELLLIPSNRDERGYKEPSKDEIKGLSRQFMPTGSGENWVSDYAIFGKKRNPANINKDVLSSEGAHWLAGFGGNTLITYTERIPEEKIEIHGVPETLATLYNMICGEGIEYYQAILNTTRIPIAGKDIVANNLIALGVLEEHR